MMQPFDTQFRLASVYALDALQALPCGCIAAVYQTPSQEMAIVSLEARGPHCLDVQHQDGTLLAVESGDETRRLIR